MDLDDEITQRQLRNIKNKIVDMVHKSPPSKIIHLAKLYKINIPRNLLQVDKIKT